jgi:hypothetical protein
MTKTYLGADVSVLVAALVWCFLLPWCFFVVLLLEAGAVADWSPEGVVSAANTGLASRIRLRTGTTCLNIEGLR